MRHLARCTGRDPSYPTLECSGCAPRSDALSEMGRWDPSGFEDGGDGIWIRERSPRCFIVIRYTDMMEHIPESEQGPEFLATRYDATVSMVDLDAIGRSEVAQAMSGWDLSDMGCDENAPNSGCCRSDNKSDGNDPVYIDSHQHSHFPVLGGCAHGLADSGKLY